MFKLGSIERPSGEVWDHKWKTELVQIFISYGDAAINFVQFAYLENGNFVLPDRPSSASQGSKLSTVTLNYPDEFLTSITGSYSIGYNGNIGAYYYMTSITFGTNQGSHGPFGVPDKGDREFNFQMGQHRPFGGFHGSTRNGLLESIGVYVKPIATLSHLISARKVKKEKDRFLAY